MNRHGTPAAHTSLGGDRRNVRVPKGSFVLDAGVVFV